MKIESIGLRVQGQDEKWLCIQWAPNRARSFTITSRRTIEYGIGTNTLINVSYFTKLTEGSDKIVRDK